MWVVPFQKKRHESKAQFPGVSLQCWWLRAPPLTFKSTLISLSFSVEHLQAECHAVFRVIYPWVKPNELNENKLGLKVLQHWGT